MKNYNEEIKRYEQQAEDRYDDYDDNYEEYDEDNFETGLDGNSSYEDSYEDGYEDSYEETQYIGMEDSYKEAYDGYDEASIGRINPNDRTLTITITNGGALDEQCIIFGGNENAAQPADISVVVQESSHSEVREESKANPFKIQGMKMSVSDPLQFDNVWQILRRSASGSQNSHIYQPRNATSPQNTNPNLIDDSAFEMDVTGQDSIRFNVKGNTKVTLTVTIRARVDMGNVLMGRNVAEVSTAPRPTGLPQIDLMKQRPCSVFGNRQSPRKMIRRIVRKPFAVASDMVKKIPHPHPHPHKPHHKKHHKRRRW